MHSTGHVSDNEVVTKTICHSKVESAIKSPRDMSVNFMDIRSASLSSKSYAFFSVSSGMLKE